MKSRTASFAAVLTAAGIALAGCSGGGDPASGSAPTTPTLTGPALNGSPSAAPTSGAPAASGSADDKGGSDKSGGSNGGGSAATTTPAGRNSTVGALPAGFPLPPGTTVGRVAIRPGDITAPLNVPNGDQATTYWKQQLPVAGYRVGRVTVSGAIGDIAFTGNGCTTGSRLAVSGEHVAFTCFRG